MGHYCRRGWVLWKSTPTSQYQKKIYQVCVWHILSILPYNTYYQHILATHVLSTHILSTLLLMHLINTPVIILIYHHHPPLNHPPHRSSDFKFACAKDLYLFLLDRPNFAIETHSMHMFWNYYPQHRHEIGRLRNFCQSAKAEGDD